jgi:NACalpha-BTF3-like transcription factor
MESMEAKHISLNFNGKQEVISPDKTADLLNKLALQTEIMKYQLEEFGLLYAPISITLEDGKQIDAPSAYLDVHLRTLEKVIEILSSKLASHNLLPNKEELPPLPTILDIIPNYPDILKAGYVKKQQLNLRSMEVFGKPAYPNVEPLNNQVPTTHILKPESFNELNDNSKEEIKNIVEQAECSNEIAMYFYRKNNNDIVDSIMQIFELKQNEEEYNKLVEELSQGSNTNISDTDIQLVVEQSGCSESRAREALLKHNEDIVEAIMEITKEQDDIQTKEVEEKTEKTEKTEETEEKEVSLE